MPSLYESTVNTGEVASSNFTTLYNSSGLQVPSAGAGQITGNLNVGGNLTVQGNSLLVGDVTLQGNLCLPNYCFPYPDGNTDQVMTTDGNGNLTWVDVNAIPGADYNISATTATGGANLTLANTAGVTDSVKFASGTNITVSRTDANTITISTVADNIPDGTAAGELLVWDGTAWTANNVVTSLTAADRFIPEFKNIDTSRTSSAIFRRNYASTAYTTGLASSIAFQFASDSQANATQGAVGAAYDAANPSIFGATSIDNFTTSTVVFDIDSTDVKFDGTNLVLNANGTGSAAVNATITVERGTTGTDATITWDETDDRWELSNDLLAPGLQGGNVQIAMTGLGSDNEIYIGGNDLQINTDGSHVIQSNSPIQTTAQSMSINSDNTAADSQLNFKSTTQYLKWNNTTQQFELSNATLVGGNLTVNGIYSQTGESITINSDSTAADSFLYLKGTTEYLKWNDADTRFEFSDQIYNSQTDVPAIFERRSVTADINTPLEFKSGLRLTQRVTDAPDNDTTQAGPGITFTRTSGATATTERLFASLGSVWDGATQTVDWGFNWSNDNFTEPTPGIFPGTYTLLRMGSNDSEFYNNSIYIDYSAQGTTRTATSIITSNTLVFGSAHGYSSGDRIQYTSTTQNGLTQNAYYYVIASGLTSTQCQLGLTSTGSAIALTNGTGLTLNFADMINRVGINEDNPQYTLDVDGDANVSGDIYISGVHVDLTIPVQQGQLLYVSDDVTPTITNSSTITFDATANRLRLVNNVSGGITALDLLKQYTTTLSDGTRVAQLFGFTNGGAIVSPTNPIYTHRITSEYDTGGNPVYEIDADPVGNFAASSAYNQLRLDNDYLGINGNQLVVNTNLTSAPTEDGIFRVNRGSSTDATLTWSEGNLRWEVTTDFYAPQATIGNIDINRTAGQIDTNSGFNLTLDSDGGTVLINDNLNVDSGVLYVDAASNEVGINTTTPTNALSVVGNADVSGSIAASEVSVDGVSTYNSQTTTTTSTSATSISSSTRNSQKAIIRIIDNVTGEIHMLEALAFYKGTTAYLTTYAEMYTSAALATFTADVSGGAIRILATPASTNSTTFTVARISLS